MSKKMTNTWDEWAEEWDRNDDVAAYSAKAFDSLTGLLNIKGLNLLDFGCGTGQLSEKLSPAANHIVALDSSPKMIERLRAKQLHNVHPICGELSEELINSNLALQSKFDLIVASSVCAFLANYEATLPLINSLMGPHGWFIQWDWKVEDDQSSDGFTETEVESALAGAGFTNVSVTTKFVTKTSKGSLPVLMAVARSIADPCCRDD